MDIETKQLGRPLSEQKSASLVAGVIEDAKKLVELQLALLRAEMHDNASKAKRMTLVLVMAALAIFPGIFLLGIAFSEWLVSFSGWNTGLCHLIVAVVFISLGTGMLLRSQNIWDASKELK